MYCRSLDHCFEQIRAYANGKKTGYPLVVNTENYHDFQEILHRLEADSSKQCVYVSGHTYENGLPDIQKVKEIISGSGCYLSAGISQSMMLQGAYALDETLDECLNLSIRGHAIILVSHCRIYLEKYRQRDLRMENRMLLLEDKKSELPKIRLAESKEACAGMTFDDGIRALLSHLEKITDAEIAASPLITVVTSFSPTLFRESMYAVSAGGGIYDVLTNTYFDLAGSTAKDYGTDKQWLWLHHELKNYSSFLAYILTRFDAVSALSMHLGEVLESNDANQKWLLWLALKVFGAQSNRYLTLVLSNSTYSSDLEEHIYKDLLEISFTEPFFDQCFSERKRLIALLPENLQQISSYCQLVGRHGKNAVYYLTDATESEEYTFMQLLDQYEWGEEELLSVISHGFPELSLYMKEFVFDTINTKLPGTEEEFRYVLTDYFNRYKSQKVRNHIDEDFLDYVEQFAEERPFYMLQPRSSILSSMNKEGAQGFFFDALGVEYLSYIQAKCEQYGLICEIAIGHCELPSITVKNKEFKHYFDTKDIRDLDELKHHSADYDYQKCPYPIHVFRELEIIDREIRRIRAQLIQNVMERAVVISDHGASRLAVIYQHENQSSLQLDEKGEHSGRCCLCAEDPHIPKAAYEDGYAVLGNYERFRGGRRANLEVHGGASLEEVVVPVLTLSLKPDNVVYYFVNPVIKYKVGKPSELILFSNAPMNHPRLQVEGVFYDGVFQEDKHHVLFSMAEQKHVREYKAAVYEGEVNTGVELSFQIERNTKIRNLFG